MVAELVESIPYYIEDTTGISVEEQKNNKLCHTLSTFLIQLFYFPEGNQAYKLQTVIDSMTSLLKHSRELGK